MYAFEVLLKGVGMPWISESCLVLRINEIIKNMIEQRSSGMSPCQADSITIIRNTSIMYTLDIVPLYYNRKTNIIKFHYVI